MTTYFTYELDRLEALAAIEAGVTIPAETVDNTPLEKALEKHAAILPGNRAELLHRLITYIQAKRATEQHKADFGAIFAQLKSLQARELESRRNVRTALLQTVHSENLVHPLDPDKDNKEAPLPPFMGFEGQKRVFYSQAEVLAYCLEYMPQFVTIDWAAFDAVMAKTNGYRDNAGNSILDDKDKPLPPVVVGRVARETISGAEMDKLPEMLDELEFSSLSEKHQFFSDVHEYFTQDDTYNREGAIAFVRQFLPVYAREYLDWS